MAESDTPSSRPTGPGGRLVSGAVDAEASGRVEIHYRFDPSLALLVARAAPGSDEEAFFDYARRVAADPAVPAGCNELVDLRALDASRLTSDGLRRLASIFQSNESADGDPVRVAIVAGSDLAFGLSRMYQAFRGQSRHDIRVFRRISDACRWLEVPDTPGLWEDPL